MADITIAESIVERLAAHGVRYIFGVPGGDCNLDIIDAGARHGIEFVLTRAETPAAMMASVVGELTGARSEILGLAVSPQGAVYAWDFSGTVTVWDLASRALLFQFRPEQFT